MSNLQDLVPPLELCKRIPEGAFAESALVYVTSKYSLNHRFGERLFFDELKVKKDYQIIPAPTLQEIFQDTDAVIDITVHCHKKNEWIIDICPNGKRSYRYTISDNPATAALTLWLRVNQPDRTDKTNKEYER